MIEFIVTNYTLMYRQFPDVANNLMMREGQKLLETNLRAAAMVVAGCPL
jgi:hypothetical protein